MTSYDIIRLSCLSWNKLRHSRRLKWRTGKRKQRLVWCCRTLILLTLQIIVQITEALERVALIGGVVPLIPDLVARLHALKDLHERASQFAGSVSYMSDSQSEMSKQINAVKQLLTEVCLTLHSELLMWTLPLSLASEAVPRESVDGS